MNKKIREKLRSKYDELEKQPSADLWDQIDSALENKSSTSQKLSFSLHWWKYAAVVLLLISLGSMIYYTGDFNPEKSDHIVKKNLKRQILETENNSEIISQEDNTEVQVVSKIVKESSEKIKQNGTKDLISNKETFKPQILEPAEKEIALNESEKQIFNQENIENKISPVISEPKKISYISANDLLFGNELDKTRENVNMEKRNFGVIHLNKVLPKFGDVTVLGVSIYVDPK